MRVDVPISMESATIEPSSYRQSNLVGKVINERERLRSSPFNEALRRIAMLAVYGPIDVNLSPMLSVPKSNSEPVQQRVSVRNVAISS